MRDIFLYRMNLEWCTAAAAMPSFLFFKLVSYTGSAGLIDPILTSRVTVAEHFLDPLRTPVNIRETVFSIPDPQFEVQYSGIRSQRIIVRGGFLE